MDYIGARDALNALFDWKKIGQKGVSQKMKLTEVDGLLFVVSKWDHSGHKIDQNVVLDLNAEYFIAK